MTYENGIYRVFRNVGTKNSDLGESPKRKNTIFTLQLKFGIKRGKFCSLAMPLWCMQIHILLTLGEDKAEWSASHPSRCTPSKRTSHRYWAGDQLTVTIRGLQIYVKWSPVLGPFLLLNNPVSTLQVFLLNLRHSWHLVSKRFPISGSVPSGMVYVECLACGQL